MHPADSVLLKLSLYGLDLSITSTVIVIWISALLVFILFALAARQPKLVPGTLQGTLESILELVESFTKDMLGEQGKVWLPFLIALFCFILFCNLLGLVPGLAPPTSNINVTAALAVSVFLIVQTYGLAKNGPLKYLGHLVPEGIPWYLYPLFVVVEFFSQLAKPFSLAIRLFANLFAGHTTLMVVISLILLLHNYLLYLFPIAGYITICLFEIFIGFIQAFIFTLLTIFYLSEVNLEKGGKDV